jgi:hypothetical protein
MLLCVGGWFGQIGMRFEIELHFGNVPDTIIESRFLLFPIAVVDVFLVIVDVVVVVVVVFLSCLCHWFCTACSSSSIRFWYG